MSEPSRDADIDRLMRGTFKGKAGMIELVQRMAQIARLCREARDEHDRIDLEASALTDIATASKERAERCEAELASYRSYFRERDEASRVAEARVAELECAITLTREEADALAVVLGATSVSGHASDRQRAIDGLRERLRVAVVRAQ